MFYSVKFTFTKYVAMPKLHAGAVTQLEFQNRSLE